tara:strand:+ start:158 stop:649 length:492 start_codon:yes stop_codon:yes gene_type:complete
MRVNKKIILGLDPGFADTGFGLLQKDKNGLQFIDAGSIQTSRDKKFSERLVIIYQEIKKLIKKYKPDIVGIEKLYFARNVKTALDVAQARGVVILASEEYNIDIVEFSPVQVKQAVTSHGGANKKQVGLMVKTILKLKEVPQPDDAADALAIAIITAREVRIK